MSKSSWELYGVLIELIDKFLCSTNYCSYFLDVKFFFIEKNLSR